MLRLARGGTRVTPLLSSSSSSLSSSPLSFSSSSFSPFFQVRRGIANEKYDGVVLGIYENGELTPNGKALNDLSNGLLKRQWDLTKKKGKIGDSLLLLESIPNYPRIAIVGLGKHEGELVRTNMRKGAAVGTTTLRDNGALNVGVDTSIGNTQVLAEGAYLSLYKYDRGVPVKQKEAEKEEKQPPVEQGKEKEKEKEKDAEKRKIEVGPFPPKDAELESWQKGKVLAQAQNIAKQLADTPANLMTPKIFISKVQEMFSALPNKDKFEVIVHDENWIQEKGMGLLYGVAKGSSEPPRFLEIHYRNCVHEPKQLPLMLVGKGVCFDSGGYSLKPGAAMVNMKGDMLGAATVVCAMQAIIQLGLHTNVSVIVPLVENMVAPNAVKPGDVLTGMNGKTVEITNTDAEGRLILADALVYAHQFKPHTIIDVATLTGAIAQALGGFAVGAFTPETLLFRELEAASAETNEKVWRMPLYSEFKPQLKSQVADMINSSGKAGGASSAAIFLKEFVQLNRWLHLDIAGVMTEGTNGMSGKPVRTLVRLAEHWTAKPPEKVTYFDKPEEE